MKIGFIGLGQMGAGIAANLTKAGHELVVWNRSAEPAIALGKLGARVAEEPRETLRADVLFSMLANDQAVQDVILDSGLLTHAPQGLVHVNLATISLDMVRKLTKAHRAFDVGYVAAPVFGRPDAAAAGKLVVVAAGSKTDIATVKPLLESVGRRLDVVAEEPEKANIFKIAGNFMLASAIETMGEAFALVRKGGVDARIFHDVLSNSLFACTVYQGYGSAIVEERFEPAGFPVRLGMKDVRLALDAARSLSTPLPLAGLVQDHFVEAEVMGFADKDWASLGGLLAKKAGL